MITQPLSGLLLESVRSALQSRVLPHVSDPQALVALDRIDSILGSVARRCDHEIAWMREEMAQTAELARELIDAGEDRDGAIAEALAEVAADTARSDHMPDVQADYSRASELLSRCLEVTVTLDGPLHERGEAAIRERLAREVEIRGDFVLIGQA